MRSSKTISPLVFPLEMGTGNSFDQVFKTYYAPLCFYCEQLTGTDAQDLVAELFMAIWQRNTTFENQNHVKAYLYRSAKNACLNLLGRSSKILEKEQEIASHLIEEEEDQLQAMIRSEVWGEIYRAIESLPSQCSKVIAMSYIDGKSNQEIADEMELSMQTVKNYKQRGLHLLKDKLPENLFVLLMVHQ
jgi:RNA polymerase sigma-70 factor (family 1)